jgi:hypothetical protein
MQEPLNQTDTNSQQYRKGDWVEVRRKPKNDGAYLKRGNKVQVDFVHPINGSVKFWNNQCKNWDYLWPEDIKPCKSPAESVVEDILIVEPVVENPSPVESVVEIVESASNASGWLDFHYKVRIDGRQHSTRQKQDKSTGPYYIYRWLEGKRQRAKYVPAKKMGEVYRAIGMKRPPNEIIRIIESPNKLDKILKK